MGRRRDIPLTNEQLAAAPNAPSEASVLIISPRGEQYTVHPSKLGPFLEAGFQVASDIATEDLLREQKYGDQNALTAIEGFARGASFGLSDIFATQILGASGFEMEQRAIQNPVLAPTSEVVGAIVPALLPGGQFAPAGAAARGGARIAAMGAEGGRLARLGASAAGTAFEGGLMSTGLSLGGAARRGEELSTAASEAMRDGLLGAGLGGAAGFVFTGGELALRNLFKRKAATVAGEVAGPAIQQELQRVRDVMKMHADNSLELANAEAIARGYEMDVAEAAARIPAAKTAPGKARKAATPGSLEAEYRRILDSYAPMQQELRVAGAEMILAKRAGADKLWSLARYLRNRGVGGAKDAGIELAGDVGRLADEYMAAVAHFDDVFATSAVESGKKKAKQVLFDIGPDTIVRRLESDYGKAIKAVRDLEERGQAFMAELEKVGMRTSRDVSKKEAADATSALAGGSAEDEVISAYLRISGGELNKSVTLEDLRAALPGLSRRQQDDAITELFLRGDGVLFPEDNTRHLTEAMDAARLSLAGEPKHYLKLDNGRGRSNVRGRSAALDINQPEVFSAYVSDAIERIPAGFGDRKVYISDIWDDLSKNPQFAAMGEDVFKQRLADANRLGDVGLARADLVSAMDPTKVARSEVPYLNANFHFAEKGLPRKGPSLAELQAAVPAPARGAALVGVPGELEAAAAKRLDEGKKGLERLMDSDVAEMLGAAEAKFAKVPEARAAKDIADASSAMDPTSRRIANRRVEQAELGLSEANRKLSQARQRGKPEAIRKAEVGVKRAEARVANARDALAKQEESAAAKVKAAKDKEAAKELAAFEKEKAVADKRLRAHEEDLAKVRDRIAKLRENEPLLQEAKAAEPELRKLVEEMEPMLAKDGVKFTKGDLAMAAMELGLDYSDVLPPEVEWLVKAHLISKLMTGRGIIGRGGNLAEGLATSGIGGVGRGLARQVGRSLGIENPLLVGGMLGVGGRAGREVAQAALAKQAGKKFISPALARQEFQRRVTKSLNRLTMPVRAARRVTPAVAAVVLSKMRFAEMDHRGDGDLPDLQRHYERRAKELDHVMQDPDAAAQEIAASLVNRGLVSPDEVEDVVAAMMPTLGYLHSALPPPRPSTPFDTRRNASRQEMRDWAAKARIATDPAAAAEDLADQTLTADSVNILREVAPEAYATIQGRTVDYFVDHPDAPRRLREYVSMTMELPLALSLTPDSAMASMAAAAAQRSLPPPEGAPAQGSGTMRSNQPTQAQRLMGR